MSTTTTNLGLTKPELSEQFSLASWNGNSDILDAFAGEVNTALAGKASAANLTAETTARQNADAKHLAALQGLIDDGAKNRLHFTDVDASNAAGCVYTVNPDGTVSVDVSGKTGASYVVLRLNSANVAIDDYCDGGHMLSGCPTGGGSGSEKFRMYAAKSTYAVYDYGEGAVLPDNGAITGINVVIYIGADYEGDNLTFKPMICTAADWAVSQAYAQYCPTLPELYAMILAQQ